jgi:hypothetical protein
MSDPVNVTGRARPRSGWTAFAAAAVVLVIVAVPLVSFALDDGSTSTPGPDHKALVDTDPLAAVRAALGQTFAAGSYESDTVSESTSTLRSSCGSLGGSLGGPGVTVVTRPICPTAPPVTQRFETHTIVNFEPYAMKSQTQSSSLGAITTHLNSTTVWQLGGATVGYSTGNPGIPLPNYVAQVLGTLGPGPGAMAMLSLASRGGYLNLEEESIASATPAGTGTVRDVEVTYYDVTIDIKKLADAPDLSDVQRATIEAAIPKLEQAGYTGTQERIGIDAQGYIRSVYATTSFADGSTWVRHSVLYNFGCAPKVTMPNEPPAPPTTTPCVPPPTTTTEPPTTTSAPPASTTSTPASSTTSTSAPPSTTTTTTSATTTTTSKP